MVNHILAHFTWVDYVIIGILLISMLVGIIRGFVKEIISLIVWIAAFVIAIRFCDVVSPLLASWIHSPHVRILLSFLALLLIVLLLGAALNYLLSQAISQGGLGGVNRLLGLLFGLLRALVIVVGLFLFLQLTVITHQSAWRQSQLLPYIKPLVVVGQTLFPADVAVYFKVATPADSKSSKHKVEK